MKTILCGAAAVFCGLSAWLTCWLGWGWVAPFQLAGAACWTYLAAW